MLSPKNISLVTYADTYTCIYQIKKNRSSGNFLITVSIPF